MARKKNLDDDALVGAKGITYLMFLCRTVNQAEVARVLCKNGIVKNSNVVRVYANKLEGAKFLTKGKPLRGLPGPQKKRRVRTLEPIFHTASFHRVWKISARKDGRQLTKDEKARLRVLFKFVACFLDFFPAYFSWGVKALRKSLRNMEWRDTLQIFFEFCERLVEVCWEIKHYKLQLNASYPKKYSVTEDEEIDPFIIALDYLAKAPHRYVYNAYKRKTITDEHISALASLSQKGHKDIYSEGTILQQLHLVQIALRDPFSAMNFLHYIEDIGAILWEDRIKGISIRALNEAIRRKANEERYRISQMITERLQKEIKIKDLAKRIAMHEATHQFRREARSFEESDVNQALRIIIEIADWDITEEELRRVLVNVNVCQALEMYLDSLYKRSYVKLKDGNILKLRWEKV